MSNELTIIDLVSKDPKELISAQTTEQKAQTYIALDMLTKALKEPEKEALLDSGLKTYTGNLPNGTKKTLTIVKTDGRVEDVVEKTIDYDKAIQYAKEHNLEIPMTTPQVDTTKLENMNGFQDNVDMFVKKEIKQKPVKPTQSLRVK